jgi:hypothetical protein
MGGKDNDSARQHDNYHEAFQFESGTNVALVGFFAEESGFCCFVRFHFASLHFFPNSIIVFLPK